MSMRLYGSLLLSLLLLGCTGTRAVTSVALAPGVRLALQLPTDTLALTQKITADYRGEQHTLVMRVEADPTRVVMAGMTPTGTRLFSLEFDGQTVSSWQSPLFQAPFDGSYVLADFELATLPLTVLQAALSGDATLLEHGSGPLRQRELHNSSGETLIRIDYQHNSTRYCHLQRAYCLLLEPLAD